MTMGISSGDPSDLRFQFEIIKQLAETGRTLAGNIADIQKTQVAMLERLAKIEANTVNETVAEMKIKVEGLTGEIDKLKQIEDRRIGENAAKAAIIKWWPVIGSAMMVIWIIGRSLGFFQIPEPRDHVAAPTSVSAPK